MSLKLDKHFEDLITGIIATERDISAANLDNLPAPWHNFTVEEFEDQPEDKAELELKVVFNRDELNEEYVRLRSDVDAKSSNVAVVKLAGDFMAACERDKREQWRGRIRMMAHNLAKKQSNGTDKGALRRNTVDYITRMYIKAQEHER